MSKSIVAGGLVLAAVVGVAGVTASGGQRVAGEIDALLRTNPAQAGVQVSELERRRSFTGTSGTLRFALHGACGAAAAGSAESAAVLRYDVTHVPGAAGLMRFKGNLSADGALADAMSRALGSAALASFDGEMRYDGSWAVRWQSPAMNFGDERVAVRADASHGELRIARGGEADMNWALPMISVRGQGKALAIRDLRAQATLRDAALGLGSSRLSVAAIESDAGSLERLEVLSEASERDGLVSSVVRPSIARVAFGGGEWKDLGLEFALADVDAASVRTVQRLVAETCALQQATAAERREFMQAVATLERRGAAIRLAQVRGRSAQGAVEGGVELRLGPGGEAGPTLAERLSAKGRLALGEALVPGAQLQPLLERGFAVREGDRVVASFSLADGRLTLNGRPEQSGAAEALGVALAAADAKWQSLLAASSPPSPVARSRAGTRLSANR